jgi:beta-galactosidase
MLFGACYYPEHWPEDRWENDFDLMQKAHFNVVRMSEFAWYKLQPNAETFDFKWLDKAIGMLGHRGIKTVLGTPTSAPPKWVVDRCENIFMKDIKGHDRGFGSRRYYCYNSIDYSGHIRILVEKMAEHYKDNENVIGWQIDNELGCADTTRCYCGPCREEFVKWLKEKYLTIENLNSQWGTIFSS